jgi:hypothetical protein
VNSSQLETIRDRHRLWLRQLGILERPWLILGSAPDPTVPPSLAARSARIDINNAGRTAAALGLGPADLTIRTEWKSWAEHPDLESRALLWVHSRSLLVMRWEMWRRSNARVGELRRWTAQEREAIVDAVIGDAVAGIGRWGKATTGVAAICYGLFVGVPEIVVGGFSVDQAGHSYDTLNRARRQVDEDLFVLERIRDRPELSTTEPDLAGRAGLRLHVER